MPESRRGLIYGAAAYGLWGIIPLYWDLFAGTGALEILAHRVLWSAVALGLLILVRQRLGVLGGLFTSRQTLVPLAIAAVVISVNWGTYIWGVTHDRVVETSLGYFINPLVTVLLGVVVLGERLRPWQWVAMGLSAVAVAVLTVDYGHVPWVALILAFSFGTYGLAKKKANAPAIESLMLEALLIAPFAAVYLGLLIAHGSASIGTEGFGQVLLFASTGVVTALPLVLFGAAATRVPLVVLGLLQYLAPVLQFLLGVLWFHEDMTLGLWIGFTLVWIALSIFTVESLRYRRRILRAGPVV